MEMQGRKNEERESGFTLVELLIAIVVVGVLTAVAIVGIQPLVDDGHMAACRASADAAKAASTVFYANSKPSAFPTDFHNLITPSKVYEIPSGVTPQVPTVGTTALVGKGWTLRMTPGSATQAPAFNCE